MSNCPNLVFFSQSLCNGLGSTNKPLLNMNQINQGLLFIIKNPLEVHLSLCILKKSIESFFELLSPKPSNWTNWNLQWILWWLDRITLVSLFPNQVDKNTKGDSSHSASSVASARRKTTNCIINGRHSFVQMKPRFYHPLEKRGPWTTEK